MRRTCQMPIAVLAVAAATGMPAQQNVDTAPGPSPRFPAEWYPPSDQFATVARPVKGKPYTALLVTQGRYTNQATGSVTANSTETLQARDGEGRRHEEQESERPGRDGKPVKVRNVTVRDPVSHCTLSWSQPWVVMPQFDHGPVASVTCQALTAKLQDDDIYARAIAEPEGERTQFGQVRRVEKLPSAEEDGLTLLGTRATVTSTRDGKQQSLITTIQYSPDLQELIRMSIRVLDQPDAMIWPEFHLTNIRREEPDPKLFYPPAGYRIESTQPRQPQLPARR